MKELLDQYEIHQVVTVVPAYGEDGGNITVILWDDGSKTIIRKKLKYVLLWIKSQSLYNVDLLMKEQQVCFARKQILPVPISPKCILLPVKYRTPAGENDGAYAYVSLDWIERVESHPFSTIILKDQVGQLQTKVRPLKLMQLITIVKTIRNQFFFNVYKEHHEGNGQMQANMVREIVVSLK